MPKADKASEEGRKCPSVRACVLDRSESGELRQCPDLFSWSVLPPYPLDNLLTPHPQPPRGQLTPPQVPFPDQSASTASYLRM